jgi:hypothetical protein
MNPQFIKEFRALLFPWSVAVAAAILMPLANILNAVHVIEGGAFAGFILGLLTFVFFASLLAIGALPFGAEFQHRTFPLLLSQPIRRSLIWRHKLVAASLGIGLALVAFVLAGIMAEKAARALTKPEIAVSTPIAPTVELPTVPSVPGGMSREQAEMYQRRYGLRPGIVSTQQQSPLPPPRHDVISVWEICLAAAALLLPTLGSVSYWTLLARSTLGGMVFTAFSQLTGFGILAFVIERLGLSEMRVGIRDVSMQTAIFALAGLIYAAVFFGLSWRKFSRLEVSQLSPDTVGGSKSLTAQAFRVGWLRCRPTSSLLNLVRKEIQLQRPLFIIAGILLVLWVLAYIFILLQPSHTNFAEVIFALTIGFYIPLMSLLAGSVSLGEEKSLAIVGWHLTFPLSVWRQWWVKLAVGFGAWALLGFLLPLCLIRFGMAISSPRIFSEVEPEAWLAISLFMTAVYGLSFWAMTLFANTVRAIIGCLATVMMLCGVAAFAYWLLVEWVFPQPFVRTLLIYDSHWADVDGWILLGTSTVVLAFVQSLLQFRRLQTSVKTVVKYSCVLVVFVFVGTLGYFLLLPFTQFAPAIYLFLFMLLLMVIRRTVAPIANRAVP